MQNPLAMSVSELKKLRDNTSSALERCLYNACIRWREALQKNRLPEAEAWGHIVKELLKNTRDM